MSLQFKRETVEDPGAEAGEFLIGSQAGASSARIGQSARWEHRRRRDRAERRRHRPDRRRPATGGGSALPRGSDGASRRLTDTTGFAGREASASAKVPPVSPSRLDRAVGSCLRPHRSKRRAPDQPTLHGSGVFREAAGRETRMGASFSLPRLPKNGPSAPFPVLTAKEGHSAASFSLPMARKKLPRAKSTARRRQGKPQQTPPAPPQGPPSPQP